jgi:aminoglycoside 2''-phosphotransferase
VAESNRKAAYLQAIRARCRELWVETATLEAGGQNNDVLLVNGEYLFRFPRYHVGIRQLRREAVVLSKIREHMPLRVPEPVYFNLDTEEVGDAFLGHRIVPGEPLWPEELSGASGAGVRGTTVGDRFAHQLGGFLRALHHVSLSPELLRVLPVTDTVEGYEGFYKQVREALYRFMRPKARDWTTRHFESYVARAEGFTFRRVLKHGDFGPSNILFHRAEGRVTGVIDFGGTALGDPAYDFAGLAGGYGEAFVTRCARAYPEVREMWHRLRFYLGTFALEEALFGVEHGDEEAFHRGIRGFV